MLGHVTRRRQALNGQRQRRVLAKPAAGQEASTQGDAEEEWERDNEKVEIEIEQLKDKCFSACYMHMV